jgi:two-component system sensor kinase FixL
MKDENKPKAQLITELVELRQLVSELRTSQSEQMLSEKALWKGKKTLSQIILETLIPTFVIDDKHIVTHWNTACENLTGILAKEIVGTNKQWEAFYSIERPTMADLIMDNASKEEMAAYYGKYQVSSVLDNAYEGEDFFLDINNKKKWLFFTAAPLRNIEGKITGVIETLQDITGQKLEEKNLRRVSGELESRITEHATELESANKALQNKIKELNIAHKKISNSQETLNAILSVSPIGICFARNRILEWTNETLCRMLGYEKNFLLGKPALVLYKDAQEYQRVGRELKRKVGKNDNPCVDARMVRKDGSILYCHIASCDIDPTDTAKGQVIVLMDITERKRMEQKLIESEKRFRDISHSTADWIWEVDNNHRFTYVSGKVTEILGYDPEELIGKTPYESIMPENEVERVRKILEDAFSEQKPIADLEKWSLTKNGGLAYVKTNGVPITGENGELLGYRGVDKDITVRKMAEKKLKKTLSELERSNSELQQFAYVASHDLQEPLRKIQAFGDRLMAKHTNSLTDQGCDYLERMQNAAKRMQVLINDLLTFSRVTTKTQRFTPVDLNGIVQDCLSSLETRIEQTGGRVEVSCLPTIDADHTQMYLLMQNLISNALKFHRTEEVPLVKIHSRRLKTQRQHDGKKILEDESCQILVEDNGIGFDEKYLDRIFGVFQRLHGRGEYEGTGIGLANCHKIVAFHGGSITAKSAPGKGARFIITLPVKQHEKGGGR